MKKMSVITAGELTTGIKIEQAQNQIEIKDPPLKTATTGMIEKI